MVLHKSMPRSTHEWWNTLSSVTDINLQIVSKFVKISVSGLNCHPTFDETTNFTRLTNKQTRRSPVTFNFIFHFSIKNRKSQLCFIKPRFYKVELTTSYSCRWKWNENDLMNYLLEVRHKLNLIYHHPPEIWSTFHSFYLTKGHKLKMWAHRMRATAAGKSPICLLADASSSLSPSYGDWSIEWTDWTVLYDIRSTKTW